MFRKARRPLAVLSRKRTAGDTQTGYVLALHMNLVPDALRAKAAKKLADKIEANHGLLATGFLGTPYLLEELTKAGYAKLAYKLLLNTRVSIVGISRRVTAQRRCGSAGMATR